MATALTKNPWIVTGVETDAALTTDRVRLRSVYATGQDENDVVLVKDAAGVVKWSGRTTPTANFQDDLRHTFEGQEGNMLGVTVTVPTGTLYLYLA